MNQKLIKLNNFLFSLRKGFVPYLISWVSSIGAANYAVHSTLMGLGGYLHIFYCFSIIYVMFCGFRQMGFLTEWDKKEYWNEL